MADDKYNPTNMNFIDLFHPYFRDPFATDLSIDDFVARYEGWGFTQAYEEAKARLWRDGCNGWGVHTNHCSKALAGNWQLQHAAAYIVADLHQNRGVSIDMGLEYVRVITAPEENFSVKIGSSTWEKSSSQEGTGTWDISNPKDLIYEYRNPSSIQITKYGWDHGNLGSGWLSSRAFIRFD